MRRWPLFALMGTALSASALFAKPAKNVSDIERMRDAAGTRARFDRLETAVAQANLIFASTAGVVTQPFAIEARRLPDGAWAVRERMGVLDQSWTGPGLVFPTAEPTEESRARERFFFMLAPDHLARGVNDAAYLGLGHLQGRLCRRFEVKASAGEGAWTVFVDTDTHRLRGLRAADGNAWLFEDEELFQNQFELPTRWSRFSPEGKRMEIVQITALAFNVFLTDFKEAPAEPPVAPGLGEKR
jgi:hypothetical protein